MPGASQPFPWVGVVAPALLGLGLWWFTGSSFALIGAVLGPAMLLANWGDGIRRGRREDRRRANQKLLETESVARSRWADLERLRRVENRIHPSIHAIARNNHWDPPMDGRMDIRAGSLTRDGMPGFPWLVDVSRGVAVIGEGSAARAVWQSLLVQTSAALGPGYGDDDVTWPNGVRLHRGQTDSVHLSIRCSANSVESVTVRGGLPERGEWIPDDVTGWEHVMARIGERIQIVEWSDTVGCTSGIGLANRVPFELDVSSAAPHIAVCGRTGTGKSEFLATLLCDWAERFGPSELSWVGIDFKGGATLGPLYELTNCSGVVTDLEAIRVERALFGISAELTERERTLAREGVARVDDSPSIGRLVVVVDELPELFRQFPQAIEVFADIARRGRSLGVHLVLATQHIAPLNRDGLLGNIAVRVCFPLSAEHDVTALLGGRTLSPPAVGRPVILDAHGIQHAVTIRHGATPSLVNPRVDTRVPAPWREPLFPPIRGSDGFGRTDDVRRRMQEPARWSPLDGDVVVVGKRGSGRSTAIRALVAGRAVAVASGVTDIRDASGLVVIDDLDRLVDSLPENRRHELPALIATRRLEPEPPVFIMSTTTWSPRIHGLVPNVLTLTTPTRESHLATGEPAETFDPSAEPGVGSWRGRRVIVYASTDSMVTDAIP